MIQIEREGEIGQDVRRKERREAREVGREVMGERRAEGGTARHCHRLQTLHKEYLRCASTQILDTEELCSYHCATGFILSAAYL